MTAPLLVLLAALAPQATTVPTDIQLPGTQPGEVTLESVSKCDNCHGGYGPSVEPARNWSGSLMAHATRDPLFWATVAVAEQDFTGVGDLCLRCHTPEGWTAGRSTPTDGSGLGGGDVDGVSCDVCHTLTNPDDSEHLGVQNPPFVANDGAPAPSTEGWYGSAMYSLFGPAPKLGPYSDPASPHQALQSRFHRSPEVCGTCHDVSNSAVGDLAPRHGAMAPLPGSYSGVPGAPVEEKAAFNNAPYAYGVVERTFSEHMASAFPTLAVSDYSALLPAELRRGSIAAAWAAAVVAVPSGNYADGTTRHFTCQTCHMHPVQGKGCNKQAAPLRVDLPLHDLTGGNTWVPEAIEWLDDRGELVVGGGLSTGQREALEAGALRSRSNLQLAAALDVTGNLLRIVNLTGHKLISGYPEGRRMWLRATWLGPGGGVLREDGAYGTVTATIDGVPTPVETILDLDDPHLVIFHVQPGLSQDWAAALVALGWPTSLPVAYDRLTGLTATTLGDVAAQPAGTAHESFHFVINDTILADTRIPPYGFRYDEARKRNCLPVPDTQYGNPGPGGVFDAWREVDLEPPVGAVSGTLELLYQTTSWEYVQFLHLTNAGTVAFLAQEGDRLLAAWLATGMSAPEVMATASWTAQPGDCNNNGVPDADDLLLGTSQDCNGNGTPDECDIALGSSLDLNGNGIPDECEGPQVDFAAAPRQGLVPLTVHFTDLTVGEVSSWSWDFGDGATSTAQHPEHTYTTAGRFTVRLEVAGASGMGSLEKPDLVLATRRRTLVGKEPRD